MKTIIVGLGNPILGDDGIGWRIAQELQKTGNLPSDLDIVCQALGGISLMESLIGYDQAILIDAIRTQQVPIGTVRIFELDEITNPSYGHLSSAHDTSLQTALQIGRDLGAQLPHIIKVVAIEAVKVYDFSEELSLDVSSAIPDAINTILTLVSNTGNSVD